MEKILEKHRNQLQLNERLRQLVEKEGPKATGEIMHLLHQGADPNDRPPHTDSLVDCILHGWPADSRVMGIELLTSFGASVNLPGLMGETPLASCLESKYPSDLQDILLSKGAVPITASLRDFASTDVHCRYGAANPEKVTSDYYTFMVATGTEASFVGPDRFRELLASGEIKDFAKDFEELTGKVKDGKLSAQAAAGFFNYLTSGKPKWCSYRFGSSYHFLEDGKMLQIGGEHEDYYEPDFNIYNDVIRISPTGTVDVFLYPEQVFPPTDFHTSTKVGNQIIIIGGLGYQKDRVARRTNMHILDLDDFSITSMSTSGKNPGWIFKHTTLHDEENHCLYVLNGKKWTNGKIIDNDGTYRFDLVTKRWSCVV
ncbi:hypothetical protein [Flavilitoribacter nigricans]|uniref:Ankyrin repeat domain-containing protein n=1 Tax=Flavilitoribacter nigricans (strain ATCC 23147 / DSM 23189 / NBRC 102662 / NCIMB 1420 / SS-2) TaxID=1122177 RepID=A0A2D0N0Z9_FLAN2|nr:hypothetical protein [Flavilitoribacter nigricans]PHN02110.1 hypothetical protein CRP01_33515 [Flavilitoribacter nigricans DSM 23189 = NBRC 102662]